MRSTRRLYQDTMRDDLIEAVEGFAGRTAVAFLSDHQIDPDYAVVFVLADGSG